MMFEVAGQLGSRLSISRASLRLLMSSVPRVSVKTSSHWSITGTNVYGRCSETVASRRPSSDVSWPGRPQSAGRGGGGEHQRKRAKTTSTGSPKGFL